jgi:hypothetical protein
VDLDAALRQGKVGRRHRGRLVTMLAQHPIGEPLQAWYVRLGPELSMRGAGALVRASAAVAVADVGPAGERVHVAPWYDIADVSTRPPHPPGMPSLVLSDRHGGELVLFHTEPAEIAAVLAQHLVHARSPEPAGGAGPADLVGQLAELASLRDRGALTEAEFTAAKQRLLGT